MTTRSLHSLFETLILCQNTTQPFQGLYRSFPRSILSSVGHATRMCTLWPVVTDIHHKHVHSSAQAQPRSSCSQTWISGPGC